MIYKKKGSDTYHWRKDCSQVPGNAPRDQYWMVFSDYADPDGEPCKECISMDQKEGINPKTRK